MSYYSEWKKAADEKPYHPIPQCDAPDVWWRTCEDDEGHEDYQHECRHCKTRWWGDGEDA